MRACRKAGAGSTTQTAPAAASAGKSPAMEGRLLYGGGMRTCDRYGYTSALRAHAYYVRTHVSTTCAGSPVRMASPPQHARTPL